MTLAAKYQSHAAFLEVSGDADKMLREIAEAYGVLSILEDTYETAAGNVVDDITRLLLLAIERKAIRNQIQAQKQ